MVDMEHTAFFEVYRENFTRLLDFLNLALEYRTLKQDEMRARVEDSGSRCDLPGGVPAPI